MTPSGPRLLIVDDSPEDRATFRRFLTQGAAHPYVILESETGEQGYELYRTQQPDCLLLDYNLPDLNGLEFLARLHAEAEEPLTTVVLVTGAGNEAVAVQAMKTGALDYLVKATLTARTLQHAVDGAIQQSSLRRELQRSRRELEQHRAELERRNRDLEMLLHVTSHDLREPLRAIHGFARLLHDQYADRLDPKGQDFLRRLMHGANRMEQLVQDVMTLLRAQRTVEPNDEVDGSAIVAAALRDLQPQVQETAATVRVADDLPRLCVDRPWVTQAMFNLLSNALKFTRDGQAPEIEVAPYREADTPAFAGLVVRDRGPGVEPHQTERIFQLFQRAVGTEVEGTGAGLAIVREVVERHGGRAWVRPREGGGSEFIITLPRPAAP